MKRLILLRHAQAAAKTGADFDRALATAGRDQIERVASFLLREGLRADQALVSPAARTRETWELAAAKLGEVPVRFDQRIYEGDAETLLAAVRDTENGVGRLILVAHNPSIHELAYELLGSGRRETALAPPAEFPTAGVAVIDLEIASWRDAVPRSGRLALFIGPDAMG